jgi:hypothetical protein
LSYVGADRLDITRKSATDEGIAFAPSWGILTAALDARRKADECMKGAQRDGAVGALHRATAWEIESAAWTEYEPRYVDEMRRSYEAHRDRWRALLARERVTLVCFCNLARWPGHCHRVILAGLLVKCGAEYVGERM